MAEPALKPLFKGTRSEGNGSTPCYDINVPQGPASCVLYVVLSLRGAIDGKACV